MQPEKCFLVSVFVLAAGIEAACAPASESGIAARSKLLLYVPLPDQISAQEGPPSEEMIALGRMLYYDARLSRSQRVSCNSCHPLASYGVDGQPTSTGHNGQRGDRNSPTVYNAAAHFAQFWDGRAPDVEEQAKGPMLNPIEMAMPSGDAVTAVLKSIPGYMPAFQHAFPDSKEPITFNHAAKAIGAFERKLLTPSRWDGFLRGDDAAISEEEKRGFNVFADAGCGNCHAGELVGGQMLQRLGIVRGYPDTSDLGRYRVTGREEDRMVFKVPSLRNVTMTGPYFHNGKVPALRGAVVQMAEYQLGMKLDDSQTGMIVTWLQCLTGAIPVEYIKQPEMPSSTPRTPKPLAGDD